MWTATFWKKAAERAIKTAAQAALAFFVVGQTELVGLDWQLVLSGAGVAAIASVLTSLASALFGPDPESPSLVGE